MRNDTRGLPLTLWLCMAMAVAVVLGVTQVAGAQSDEWCVDRETAIQVRDKARAYEILCDALPAGADIDADLSGLCEEAGGVSRIWVKAQMTDEARRAARKAQREANRRAGQLEECRVQRDVQARRIDKMSDELDASKRQSSRNLWLAGAGGTVTLVLGAILAGELTGLWDLGPR